MRVLGSRLSCESAGVKGLVELELELDMFKELIDKSKHRSKT